MIKVTFLSIIFLITVNSCSNQKNILIKSPAWYSNPKQNNHKDLYGIGEGFTMEEAIKSSLNNLASRLSSSISSESSSLSQENNNGFSEQYSSKIKQTVQEININNYEITNSIRNSSNTYYAEVKINKSDLVNQVRLDLDRHNKEIKKIYKTLLTEDIITKLKKSSEINNLIDQSQRLNNILRILGYDSDYTKNKTQYDSYNEFYSNILTKIEFYIICDNEKLKNLITKILNKKGFKVLNKKTFSENIIIFEVDFDKDIKEIFNSNIAQITINFKLKNIDDKIYASDILKSKGSSLKSKDEAINEALKNFSKKLENSDILKILTLKS